MREISSPFGQLSPFGRSGAIFPRYRAPDGTFPSLVLDFTRQFYAVDESGSLRRYDAPDGTPASLVLDFTLGEYGGPA